jgi:phosphoglycolate phosphatase
MRSAIVFDLDGTLVDSLPDIVASFLAAFDGRSVEKPTRAAVEAAIGEPLEKMYAAFAPRHEIEALSAYYRSHYRENFRTNSRPFPGVPDLLDELGERGFLRVVATTKRTDLARAFVEAMGLSKHLDHVQGTDDFPAKPAPDVVHRAIAAVGGRGTWMVGDTVHDIEAGRAAGLQTYAVTWGTHTRERLAALEPDVLAPDLTRLVAQVATA